MGVSKLGHESKKKFIQKHNLKIELLSDEDCKVAEKYGALKEKNIYGKKRLVISRDSFLIDKKGKIVKHWEKVNASEHPDEVLEFVKSLGKD